MPYFPLGLLTTGTRHNDLSGLQGGTTAEYYHLTNAAYSNISNGPTATPTFLSVNGASTFLFNRAGTEVGRWNATSDLVVGGAGDWFGNAALLGRGFFIQRENMDSSVEMLTARALPACQFGGTVTGGTLSAPTQTPVGGQMNVRLRGRDNASNWVVGAVLSMQATEAWSTTARGSLVAIDTVLTGGSTLATRFSITGPGSIALGTQAAIATTATDGFVYIPTCAGTPTGVPTAITGLAPMVVNTTNNKLYFYSGGAWRDAGP